MRTPSVARALTLFACTALLVAGCGDDSNDPADGTGDDASAASTPASATPPPPPPPPKTGRCYDLGEDELASASSDAEPVPCKDDHTAQTYLVDTLPERLTDTRPFDANAIADEVSRRCDQAFAEHVGGDTDTRTLSRVHPVWFVPAEEEMGRGAHWFRCDVAADLSGSSPAPLPPVTKGMLAADDALSRWGTCAPADSSHPEAEATLCSRPHGIRAIEVIDLGEPEAAWPGADTLAARGDECETAVRDYVDDATGALAYQWTYPAERQWKAGRRFGLCWSDDGP